MVSSEAKWGLKEARRLHLILLTTLEGGRRKFGVENVVPLCLLFPLKGIQVRKKLFLP